MAKSNTNKKFQRYNTNVKGGWFVFALFFVVLSVANTFVMTADTNAVTSSSSLVPESVVELGSSGSGDGQFTTPTGITSAPNGDIYVVDRGMYRVQRFSDEGVFKSKWGSQGTGNGQFQNPIRLAADSDSNIYVVDTVDASVSKFTSSGTFITKLSGFTGVGIFDVATDSNDNLYVLEVGGTCNGSPNDGLTINKFTSSGTPISQWCMPVEAGTTSIGVPSFTLDSVGNIYVVVNATINSTAYSKVQKYTNSGTYVMTIGGEVGSGDGELSSPYNVAIDNENNVYVADTLNSRVQKFDSNGHFISKWGTSGTLGTPFDITVIGNTVYVVDFNGTVKRFYYPQNLAGVTALNSQSKVDVALPEGCDITSHAVLAPTAADKKYTYPLGLTSFTFSTSGCSAGMTIPVNLTFQTDLRPADVVARKYSAITQKYMTISDATITETTVDGKHALQLSYSVTDGGPLDEDGVVNGVIVDPVGLGTLAVGAPNTGFGPVESAATPTLLAPMAASFALTILGFCVYRLVKMIGRTIL